MTRSGPKTCSPSSKNADGSWTASWLHLAVVCCVLIAATLLPTARAAEHNAHGTDVIVDGSSPAGLCAAIAAAREGASVILLEPTDHVGGLNTGGLSHSDSNQTVRSTVIGLFDEWHSRI